MVFTEGYLEDFTKMSSPCNEHQDLHVRSLHAFTVQREGCSQQHEPKEKSQHQIVVITCCSAMLQHSKLIEQQQQCLDIKTTTTAIAQHAGKEFPHHRHWPNVGCSTIHRCWEQCGDVMLCCLPLHQAVALI